jgi:hypothetical protein
MDTTASIPFRSKDSFLSDPPNADVSIIEGSELAQVVRPRGSGAERERSHLFGEGGQRRDSRKGSEVSVSIEDMPLTALSHAGLARRGYRRAFL